ncbi:hypothetical protein TraAM80_04494 [Trypanosoma rangeli]|uniref:Uncharacterized protein n=1 Tax=Trypanosoma rangeli TaxID=5698 RepID=A0A422NJC1_TRYRA|nr:uncharacterized protein TraAM80_04494 [Trypanosoma rangeli]RNF05555.1 hypothetical protein TraAM80_04494 [Trypanosoma rangeli]|eukprot:RNF05555.1 hypothetical protein TraAM80_04494 [Trypanosoma rangeli]
MGSHARKGHKPKSRAAKPNTRHAGDSSSTAIHESPVVKPPPVPPCVAKLTSTDWNVVEEGCADVAAFALQPLQHANLLAHAVPQRLTEILFAAAAPASAGQPHETNSQASLQQPHAGVFYLQTAAAEALRNFVVNSVEDVVVDALAASKFPMCGASQDGNEGGVTFRDGLVALLMTTWDAVQNARRDAPLVPPAVVQDEEGGDMRDSLRHAPFVVAARALEEVLQLIAVCVEGNEHVAEAFSAPHVLRTLLSLLEATTSVVWETLQHPAQLYRATVESGVVWLRQYKRREAELLAAVAVAGSEVLHVLSDENEALASLLQSSEMMASHQAFLTSSLDATTIMAWLREEEPSVVLTSPFLAATAVAGGENEEEREDDTLLSTGRQNILYQLCQVSLRVQGTLMNSVSSTANAARVLPLVVAVLDAHPPHSEWRRTVPLLLQECALGEEHRAALVQRALWRLRCDQAAVNVLHAAVDAICSLNEADADDETAFQRNPQASLLYSTNAMYVVGKLMKDALRLTPTNANSNNNNSNPNTNTETTHVSAFGSVNCEDDVMVERALRAAAGTSGTGGFITKLQLLVLSNEVGVWSLANTLLMMVPWSGLGAEPAHIWRAIIHAISLRSQLLAEAVAGDVNARANGVTTVLETTPAAMNLLRLQLESLVQMLWTLQRKQAAHAGGPLQVTNHLAATAADVDVVTRLAWDTHATPLQKQACVGVVCATCTSFKSAEATTAAARFALGILQVDDTLQSTTAAALAAAAPPPQAAKGENGETRRRWMANIAATDAQWRVRCEASNHIMDLFLDETHDDAVYVPLRVHAALKSFLTPFQAYLKRRQQMVRETQRNYRIVLPGVEDAANWCEVAENLSAFLEYKTQHIGRQRL